MCVQQESGSAQAVGGEGLVAPFPGLLLLTPIPPRTQPGVSGRWEEGKRYQKQNKVKCGQS